MVKYKHIFSTKKNIFVFLCFFSFLVLFFFLQYIFTFFHIMVNVTPSMPLGFYRIESGLIHKGDHIVFCPPEVAVRYQHQWNPSMHEDPHMCPKGGTYYLKYVQGMPGDTIQVKNIGVFINNVNIPFSKPLQRTKSHAIVHPLLSIVGEKYILKNGEYWAGTPEWYSFDSRYYGPIHQAQKVIPLLTYPLPINLSIPPEIQKLQDETS